MYKRQKLGLANIVVMYALFFMGARQALYLDLLKALSVSYTHLDVYKRQATSSAPRPRR